MIRAALIVAFIVSVTLLSAQGSSPQQSDAPRFEVASVKPLPAGSNRVGYRPDPTRFSGYFSITEAVAFGYQIQPDRIVEMPQWAKEPRYEINARTAPRRPGDLIQMMRHMLEERFALKVHRERRPIPVYALAMSRSDGDLGPNLQRSERDCTKPNPNIPGCSVTVGAGRYRANGQEWATFVSMLEGRIAGRPVLDKTGLSGRFDIVLEWNPEIPRVPEDVSNAPTVPALDERPVLFTAVREQLGLKLESDTAAMDVLVIDSVARPTPD